MKCCLVLTTGQTDVQVVIENKRYKLDGKNCGDLQQKIHDCEFEFVDSPQNRARETFSDSHDTKGRIAICTPKLDAILAYFTEKPPCSVLILETTRTISSDPRLSGHFLKGRLIEQGVKEAEIAICSFLEGEEKLEDSRDPRDAVVRRGVVIKIATAIAERTKGLEKQDKVYVAATGGLAAANETISELVRLHCAGGPTVTSLEVPDGPNTQREEVAFEEKFHPASEIRARWQALSLIENGNLLGAWGAVSHLVYQPGQEWTEVLVWLKQFASSLPLDDKCDLPHLNDKRMAVSAALRVELALKAGDIPRAIHGTVAFFEAALWDGLNDCVKRVKVKDGSTLFQINDEHLGKIAGLMWEDGKPYKDHNDTKPFFFVKTEDGVNLYKIYDSNLTAGNLARVFLGRESLFCLFKTLTGKIRDLRNDVSHNLPTPELMDSAKATMVKKELWGSNDTFLDQKLIMSVLTELGVGSPTSLWSELFSEIRKRLISVG
jgi:hypothetical protein